MNWILGAFFWTPKVAAAADNLNDMVVFFLAPLNKLGWLSKEDQDVRLSSDSLGMSKNAQD
jgi:hypothetical protein